MIIIHLPPKSCPRNEEYPYGANVFNFFSSLSHKRFKLFYIFITMVFCTVRLSYRLSRTRVCVCVTLTHKGKNICILYTPTLLSVTFSIDRRRYYVTREHSNDDVRNDHIETPLRRVNRRSINIDTDFGAHAYAHTFGRRDRREQLLRETHVARTTRSRALLPFPGGSVRIRPRTGGSRKTTAPPTTTTINNGNPLAGTGINRERTDVGDRAVCR